MVAFRLMRVPARVMGIATSAALRHRQPHVYPAIPPPRPTPALLAQVALDETVLALMKSPSRFPTGDELGRVAAELTAARGQYAMRGWLDRPQGYHRPPDVPTMVESRSRRLRGVRYEHLRWWSGFEPGHHEPGAASWAAIESVSEAHAYVIRHPEPDRPWVVGLHGLGTGLPIADFQAFDVLHLHRDLGVNVALPVLPLHGPRKANKRKLDEFLTFDLQSTIHGVAHAVWDVRALIAWIRQQGGTRIGLHGVSLGAYVAGLVATLEEDLDFALAGVPLADVPALYAHHCPPRMRRRAVEVGLLGEVVHEAHRVISPLAAPALLPRARLAVYGGRGDRMTGPDQARRLWDHWQQPEALWFNGNHMAFTFSRNVKRFTRERLSDWLEEPRSRTEDAAERAAST